MNKKLLIIIAVIVLVGGGVAAYVLTRSGDANENGSSAVSSKNENGGGVVGEATASLRSLFGNSQSQVCTYTSGEESGTVYVAGDKQLRMDFRSTNPEHGSGGMIMTAEKNYIWDDATKEGFITLNIEDDAATEGQNEENESLLDDEDGGVNVDEEYDFKCENWRVDSGLFVPPADVTFVDMDAMMQEQLQQLQ